MNANVMAVETPVEISAASWPRGAVRRVNDEWHVRVEDFDPIHGHLRTDHVESTWDRAWAWLEGVRRLMA